ncbi:MAG: M20/M25/M40 family metallo-hydrolase [Acidobacteriia bacterium]|nr:M20/M25/M40 family metallo-hydrolase [Terriglobia bacterium]
MRYLFRALLLAAPLVPPLAAQDARSDRPDLTIVSRIKTEAFENSRVMDTMAYLTDAYGPRLTASPEFRQAADWVVKRLETYGVTNAHLEKWGPFGRSWSPKQYALEMIEPRYALLDAAPLAWSDSTRGAVTGEIVLAPFANGRPSLDPARLEADQARYMAEWRGKLRGKIVLLAPLREVRPETQPLFVRYTDKELADLALAPTPFARRSDLTDLKFPDDPEEARRFNQSLPASVREQFNKQRERLSVKRAQFFREEGALALINTSDSSRDGLVFAQSAGSYDEKDPLALPTFVVTREQYNRMARLLDKKIAVKVRAALQADISNTNQDSYNVTGEIPGGAKKDELIMIGAHLDSWHSGTGATDNAAGCAVMIEVMRLLKALNLKLDRTVRIALWSGEEEGLLGSKAYVKEHFGDPATMKLSEAHAKLSGYFNLDNGTGKIRGVYLQGNDAIRPIFEQWLSPFRDQGVTTISIRNTGGTDHLSFDDVGLPGFQFIQDPADYETVTHHSNMDTLDHIQSADLMQAAAIISTVVYNAANRPDMLPRKALPKPQPKVNLTSQEVDHVAAAR